MKRFPRFGPRSQAAAIGSVFGLIVFAALSAFSQQTRTFSIPDILGDPKLFYNQSISLEGIAGAPRLSWKTVDYKTREQVQYVSFSLYEPGSYHGRGNHYVYVNIPAGAFRNIPNEGDVVTLTGTLKPPLLVGNIEP
ncbi:MAG TPA: hypothetical protein VNI01_09435 [Elusimicrobiota bacterium]|jgi:hypothetical protein|nr:hypothetical protein [Elusimicrobiota bacterium]